MDQSLTIFRALADPTRLRIMLLVQNMELSVGELAELLGQSQPRISRHLRILSEAGLVERHKEGSWVFLRPGAALRDDALSRMLRSPSLTQSNTALADREQLSVVRASRAKMADNYFAAHAGEWDAIRSLHVAEAEVEAAMREILGDQQLGTLVDIGTGTGRMIELFGPHADAIIAIDNSPEMLRLTRAKLLLDDAHPELASRSDLQLADFNKLPLDKASADTVILHQVLHYAQNPEHVIAEISRILRKDGMLMIVDFATHDREELRSAHAHARLGFADDSMARWLERAQFELLDDRRLDGGELTVKIWFAQKSGLARLKHTSSEISAKAEAA